MKKNEISFVLNISIVIIFIVSYLVMLFGNNRETFGQRGINSLKYFTILSNLLMCISSLILIIFEVQIFNKSREEIPIFILILKYAAVVSTTLTMLTVILYLAPFSGYGFKAMYQSYNLSFHLLVPLLGLISFLFFEKISLKQVHTLIGILPMILYAIFYMTNAFIHMENGKIDVRYDWYLFAQNGISSAIISIFVMLMSTYLISYLIYFIHLKLTK